MTPRGANPSPRGRAAARTFAYILGVGLLAAGVWVVVQDGRTFRQALHAASQAPPWMIITLLGLPLVNWALSSLIFWVLTRRFGPVPLVDMAAITGVASALNILPLRPGLLGRIVYLKQRHGVKVWDSVRVTFEAIALTVVGALFTLLGGRLLGVPGAAAAVGVLVIAGAIAWPRWIDARGRVSPGRPVDAGIVLALSVRAVEMLIWAARYLLVFAIIARPISPETALLLAASAQVVSILPIALGLREWTVAMMSISTPVGLTADLLHRAAELALSLPIGALGGLVLWARKRRDDTAPPTRA